MAWGNYLTTWKPDEDLSYKGKTTAEHLAQADFDRAKQASVDYAYAHQAELKRIKEEKLAEIAELEAERDRLSKIEAAKSKRADDEETVFDNSYLPGVSLEDYTSNVYDPAKDGGTYLDADGYYRNIYEEGMDQPTEGVLYPGKRMTRGYNG